MSNAQKWCKACQNTGVAIGLGMFKGPCDLCLDSEQNEKIVAENQALAGQDKQEAESCGPASTETVETPIAVEAKAKRPYKRKDKTSGINLIFDESAENDEGIVGLNNAAVDSMVINDTVQ